MTRLTYRGYCALTVGRVGSAGEVAVLVGCDVTLSFGPAAMPSRMNRAYRAAPSRLRWMPSATNHGMPSAKPCQSSTCAFGHCDTSATRELLTACSHGRGMCV